MTAYARHASYYLHLTDPQAVTVTARRHDSEYSDEVARASKISRRKARETFGGVALQSSEQGWNVPNELLSNISELQPGDTLKHGETTWHIREVVQDSLGTQWNLRCDKGRS